MSDRKLPAFRVYARDAIFEMSLLTPREKAVLFENLCYYSVHHPLKKMTERCAKSFENMRANVDKDFSVYNKLCDKNQRIAATRGEPQDDHTSTQLSTLNSQPQSKEKEKGEKESAAMPNGVAASPPKNKSWKEKWDEYTDESEWEGGEPYKDTGKGHRITEEWFLCHQWGELAEEWLETPQIMAEAERFKAYWLSEDAKRPVRKDWKTTWINWVRK